ncbi:MULTISPECIES: DUF6708 domain-containing protein [unclassified Pseudomonas]|uniref:DUF6708 domain-containing protein n=1 Tax=unclassified Pseudomonas TaxID=196821 RepID=UPI000CD16114|nr:MULTISPECIES: DUF6708 domain-containing protein [unclassified Pseudomonas]POA34507.1 hypothetical protein C1887_04685 [Pseudomonas sp. GW456-R21]POA70578.1 hypothetical protein C1884_04265 [Pseudomonas sp. GW460-R15]
MSTPPAGTTKKRMLSRNDYLAPLPIPTGRKPSDVLNTIWRKNEVFLDIGSYSIGSAVMVLWPMVMLFLGMAYIFKDFDALVLGACIMAIPIFLLIKGLFREVPLPVRFNRQRREVCVPRDNGEYWIVPWESVTAAATQQSSVSQAGRATMGLLIIGFENPDPQAKEDNKHFSLGFNCGGGTTAMALWECMRSYMEVGPEAVEDQTARFDRSKGIWATYLDDLIKAAKLRGWFVTALWEGFCGLFIFNTLLIDVLERWKLNPPLDLPYPDIIEWSKPLPPEQWAKRSPELDAAIAKREAELAAQATEAA